jgi:hypothetical protein
MNRLRRRLPQPSTELPRVGALPESDLGAHESSMPAGEGHCPCGLHPATRGRTVLTRGLSK